MPKEIIIIINQLVLTIVPMQANFPSHCCEKKVSCMDGYTIYIALNTAHDSICVWLTKSTQHTHTQKLFNYT